MRFEKIDGNTHIYVDDGETEQQVLRAIVKASYELARPAGMGWKQARLREQEEKEQEEGSAPAELENKVADAFIWLGRGGSIVVAMDYVYGRQCTTILEKDGDHFKLSNGDYEEHRGTPEPMLRRAAEILAGKKSTGPTSSTDMFKDQSLDLRLRQYGFIRQCGENDWDFRRRIFPDLYQLDPNRAMEFLYGSSAADWEDLDRRTAVVFVDEHEHDATRDDLILFAKGFLEDPAKTRGR